MTFQNHTLRIFPLSPGGPIPHKMAKTFDGPPTLERSGSEHRRAVTSFLLRRKAWLEVELPLAKGRRRDSKKITSIFIGKPLLVFKRTIKVLQYLMFRILLRKISVFRRNAPIDTERFIQDRDTTISLWVIEVITLILEDRSF